MVGLVATVAMEHRNASAMKVLSDAEPTDLVRIATSLVYLGLLHLYWMEQHQTMGFDQQLLTSSWAAIPVHLGFLHPDWMEQYQTMAFDQQLLASSWAAIPVHLRFLHPNWMEQHQTTMGFDQQLLISR